MNVKTEGMKREDLMGLTMAVLMFVLQGCMVLAMSSDWIASGNASGQRTMVAEIDVAPDQRQTA